MTPNSTVVFHAHLHGGAPMLDFSDDGDGWSDQWIERLEQLLEHGGQQEAIELCRPHAAAVLLADGLAGLLPSGDFIQADSVDLADVVVLRSGGVAVPVFHRWYARFVLPMERSVLLKWCETSGSGVQQFSLDRYEEWLEDNDIWGVQDGVRFSLWGIGYELDGMGENGCMPDEDSVNAALSVKR